MVILVLSSDLAGRLFTTEYDAGLRVCCKWPLLCWNLFPLHFWWIFITDGYGILSNAFSVSIEMIMWFLYFLLLMWYITLVDLQMFNHPCDPGINQTWSQYMILFIYYQIWFANTLLRTFYIYIYQRYWYLSKIFLCSSFVWFWYEDNLGSPVEWLWSIPSSLIF